MNQRAAPWLVQITYQFANGPISATILVRVERTHRNWFKEKMSVMGDISSGFTIRRCSQLSVILLERLRRRIPTLVAKPRVSRPVILDHVTCDVASMNAAKELANLGI